MALRDYCFFIVGVTLSGNDYYKSNNPLNCITKMNTLKNYKERIKT